MKRTIRIVLWNFPFAGSILQIELKCFQIFAYFIAEYNKGFNQND